MSRYLLTQRLSTQNDGIGINPTSTNLNLSTSLVANFSSPANLTSALPSANILVVEGNPEEVQKESKNLPADVIIEEEKKRDLGFLHPLLAGFDRFSEISAGIGAPIEVDISSAGKKLREALVVLTLSSVRHNFVTTVKGLTDESGRLSLFYNPTIWLPSGISVLPRSAAWSVFFPVTSSRMNLVLPPLSRAGHLGWWHRVIGVNSYHETLGEGGRVGIIDTGVGAHPYLNHVKRLGSLIRGEYDSNPEATADVADHGTHIAGTIGARPSRGSNDYAGIAPGAEMVSLRIYPGGGEPGAQAGSTTNGDIAQAILMLSRDEQCDIINISSGGLLRSEIEADRILTALNSGTLIICSVGNGAGPPILYPAADPFTIGVSAVGLTGGVPQGVLDTLSYPAQFDRYSPFGYFVPVFNSLGAEVKCTGPGVGIISTVPMKADESAPTYAAMSGTSMAAPAVTGVLIGCLSRDPVYRSLPRTRERSLYAAMVLSRIVRSLNLELPYQGFGMPYVGGFI